MNHLVGNNPSKKAIVQKFGGTSVGSGERLKRVAEIIHKTSQNSPVVVIVSALSPDKKSNGTTSLLLRSIKSAVIGEDFEESLNQVATYHEHTADAALGSSLLRHEAREFVGQELLRARETLKAISILRESTAASVDSIIEIGEKCAAKFLSLVLKDYGLSSSYEDLSCLLDGEQISGGLTYSDAQLFAVVQSKLAECCSRVPDGCVPVFTGFFGHVPGGLIERVGRGYTDFTAALAAAALASANGMGCGSSGLCSCGVAELQVWKEVDGICTADPRRVPEAQVLAELSVHEAAELTYFGSEVLHPFTMARVAQCNIPVRVKNTFNPDAPGTLVHNSKPNHRQAISAITAKGGVTSVTITSNRMYDSYGFLARAFSVLRDHSVVVDMVSTSEVSVSFTVNSTENLTQALVELEKLGTVSVVADQAILAVVGENMSQDIRVVARLFSALAEKEIDIHMISKGASQINISCVIAGNDVDTALPAVHKAFF